MTEINNNNNDDDRVQDLVDLMESSPVDFKHLQVFLSREKETDSQPNYEFLMVTPTSFGKVELLNINVEADSVILEIRDCCTQQVGNVRIDIGDSCPKTFFIRWQDIKNIVHGDQFTSNDTSGLLEFDF